MKRPTTSDIGVATSSGSGSHLYYSHSNTTATTSTITSTNQWGHQETIELINIRGQLERNFNKSKRTKHLWETVASSLIDKGFFRSPHQCKSKWKNLLNRYKAIETSDPENGKQCPFFEELHAVFTEKTQNFQQSFMESQQLVVQSRKKQKLKSSSGDHFSDDFSQDDDVEGDDSNRVGSIRNRNVQRKKTDREEHIPVSPKCANTSNISSDIQEMLRGFLQHQGRIEMQWRESMDRHQRERKEFEHEWRQSMEKLEREGLVMEQAWREREEQRKIKEDIRAEKSDALLTTLLNKLISQDNL